MVKVTIDDVVIEVEPGTTILNAARQVGGDIVPPAMCYYSKLEGSGGKCRTCLVEVTQGSEKDPRPMPKLMASCSTQVMDGMVVKNKTSERVVENRASITEFLLINHPLDCPICDQAGECKLQDLAFEHGKAKTRYEEKRRKHEPEVFGSKIKLNKDRCILCYRCVYVGNQLCDGRSHGVIHRGDHAEISNFVDSTVENDFSGNMIDVCPVGALTDNTFRFKSRVWFLNPINASCECTKCSGKAVVWMFGNEIYRVTARKDENNEVQTIDGKTAWLCNDCRYDKKDVAKWTLEEPLKVSRHSVISQGHYEKKNPLDNQNKNLK